MGKQGDRRDHSSLWGDPYHLPGVGQVLAITLHKEADPENSLPAEGTPRAEPGEEALKSRREGRVLHHDRVHSVSESRATQGLPATPSAVVSGSVTLRQKTVTCPKGSSSHYPTTAGCCPDSQDPGPFPKEDCKTGQGSQEHQGSRESFSASSWLEEGPEPWDHPFQPSFEPHTHLYPAKFQK